MAAITMITNREIRSGVQFLEEISITNQTAASTAVTKGFSVPTWATKSIFTLFVDAMAGTGEAFDFVLGVPDWGSRTLLAAPTDATDVATAPQIAARSFLYMVTSTFDGGDEGE